MTTAKKKPAAKKAAKPAAKKVAAKKAPAKKPADTPKRTRPDIQAVERDYRTGQFTDRELGAKYGVSHTAVQKWAAKGEWQKDLAGAVRAATEAKLAEHEVGKVASAEVARQVAKQVASAIPATTEVVAALAEVNSQVRIRHRADLLETRNVALAMLAELRLVGEHGDALDEIAELLGTNDRDPNAENKLRIALNKAISLPSRIGSIKALAETVTKLMAAERDAYNLDDGADEGRAGKTLTTAERASRLALLLTRAQAAAADGDD